MIVASESGRFHIANGFTTAIEEIKDAQLPDLTVYPNPTSGSARLSLKSGAIEQVTLFDVMGHKVYSSNEVSQTRTFELELSGLRPGTYLVQVVDNKGKSFVERIVVL